jgi:hypothetical protein
MPSIAQVLDKAAELQSWRDVSHDVMRVFNAALPTATLIKKASARWPDDAAFVFLQPFTGHVHIMPVNDEFKKTARWDRLSRLDAVSGVEVSHMTPDPSEYVMVKRAIKMGDISRFLRNIYVKPQEWLVGKGNASPLSMMLAGSAITGLGGLGLGTLWDNTVGPVGHALAPEYFDKKPRMGKWLGILGALTGAVPGLAAGLQRSSMHGPVSGFERPYNRRYPDINPRARKNINRTWHEIEKLDPGSAAKSLKLHNEWRKKIGSFVDPKMQKAAADYYSQMYIPFINVKEFTERVWDGVEKRAYNIDPVIQYRAIVGKLDPANDPNANRIGPGGMALNEPGIHVNTFGTPKNYTQANPYTSPASAAMAAGLVHGASASRGGSNWVSPMDVGRIAIGAGSGLLSGIVAGKILGALAGLSPVAVNNVKRIGIWAGGLNAARNALM